MRSRKALPPSSLARTASLPCSVGRLTLLESRRVDLWPSGRHGLPAATEGVVATSAPTAVLTHVTTGVREGTSRASKPIEFSSTFFTYLLTSFCPSSALSLLISSLYCFLRLFALCPSISSHSSLPRYASSLPSSLLLFFLHSPLLLSITPFSLSSFSPL